MEKRSQEVKDDIDDDASSIEMEADQTLLPASHDSCPKRSRTNSGLVRAILVGAAIATLLSSLFFYSGALSHQVCSNLTHFSSELPTPENSHNSSSSGRKTASGGSSASCGSSREEAKARGCVFSSSLRAWLPPDCLYPEDRLDEKELVAQSAEEGWQWYIPRSSVAEENLRELGFAGLEEISAKEANAGVHEVVFTAHRWHLVHCVIVWKRMTRALAEGRLIDVSAASMHHTEHCGEMLLLQNVSATSFTRVQTGYPRCVRY